VSTKSTVLESIRRWSYWGISLTLVSADVLDGGMVHEALGPVAGDADSYIRLIGFLFYIHKDKREVFD
jgi:hypothetical protein